MLFSYIIPIFVDIECHGTNLNLWTYLTFHTCEQIQILNVFYDQFPRYERARRLRVAVIHGLARMAALMASTYKAYLGVGLGPLSVGPVNCGIY